MYKSTAYDRLCLAVRSRNENGITRSINDLTVRTFVKDAEVVGHYDRITEKLERLSGILSYKQRLFNCPTDRTGHRDRSTLSSLRNEIEALTEDVRVLNRLHVVIGNELRRRGLEVGAMREERNNVVSTKVTA